ncbi:hypothetical protein [Peribacillus alkalitolerans]|uniref:hypothetical protein n=1 Tax=Peribacillus alkalitolerans TaxID=1550385 RepID=UPI0013D3D80D|nr:hypothetical protein [Peribacillus alkalitolerans]
MVHIKGKGTGGWDFRTKEEKEAAERERKDWEDGERARKEFNSKKWIEGVKILTGFDIKTADFNKLRTQTVEKFKYFKYEKMNAGAACGHVDGLEVDFVRLNIFEVDRFDLLEELSGEKRNHTHFLEDIEILDGKKELVTNYLRDHLHRGKVFCFQGYGYSVHIYIDDLFINAELIKMGLAKLAPSEATTWHLNKEEFDPNKKIDLEENWYSSNIEDYFRYNMLLEAEQIRLSKQ